jgi:Peptidase family C25
MIIWLYANEATLTSGTVDGYRLLIGDDTGNDEIFLQRVDNGVATTILTSTQALANGLTDIGFLIRVTRNTNGIFTLYTSTLPTANGTGAVATDLPNDTNVTVNQGNATDTTYTPAANGFFGVVAICTTSAGARATLELDQIDLVSAPTAVDLVSFSANSYANATYLEWQTGYEIRSLGFNLYREVAGKRERVNRSLIAGSALMAGAQVAVKAGFSYSWVDSTPVGKVLPQYWLEDTDLNGKVTLHGPIQPTAAGKLPPPAQALLLSHLNADGATARQTIVAPAPLAATGGKAALSPNAASDPLQTQWGIAVQPGVKLRIRQTGWYRVTQPELAAAGLDVSRDPRFLQLYTDAQEIPIIVNGGAGGRLGPADSIEFFGRNLDLPATDLRTYYLYFAAAPGQRIPLTNGQSGPPTGADSFSQTIERKERSIYFAALKNGDAENWFGPIITASPVDQSLNVQHLEAAGKATLEIALQGVTDVAGGPPDHHVHVLLNGNDIGALVFDGQAHYVTQFTISAGQLQEGNNVVTLTATGGDMDVSLIDYVRLTYAHQFTADNDALGYTATGREMVQVGGFTTSSLRLFDVTEPNNPTEVQGQIAAQAGGYAITAAAPGLGQRSLYAFAAGQVLQAAGVLKNQPSSWNRPNQGATALIITHRDFLGSLDPLVTLRKSQGYSVSVIDVEDLYDEFSYGARSNQAIKDFLQRTKSAWKKVPRSVLLVGDASIDPRDYLGLGDHDFVPTRTVDAATTEAPSDDALADLNNDGVAEFAVGRLPARTPQEAATMVAKIIEYERGGALEGAVVVADINDGFDFEATSHTVEGLLPSEVRTVEIFRSQMGDAGAHQAIITAINRGPKIVNYVGHGSFGLWRGNLLTNNDMALLNNRPALPLVISMTCLNGLFNDAYGDSLAEALLKAEAGGAIAVWSSSALTDPAVQALMNQEAIRQLFIGAPTLGDAMKRAKSLVPDGDVRRTWNLLGDPLTRLH